jgi:uncharacterized protein YjbJ (UPF0337 family)
MAGRMNRAKGRFAEAIGALFDNKKLKDKGRAARVKGTTKLKANSAAGRIRSRAPRR